ncbi:MAG: hypothetical protein ABFE13_22110 [Phycisphaerales bacterium]
MIKAAYTIGMAAITVAGLILTLCIRNGQQADSPAEQTLTAVERFRQSNNSDVPVDLRRESPLVQQAQAFALYLNPAPAIPSLQRDRPLQTTDVPSGGPLAAGGPRPSSTSLKFELHGISYYRANPNQSMALICEPGGDRRWVRQGDSLGHVVVERIDADCLVCRDGAQMETMALASDETIARFAQESDGRDRSPKPRVSAALNTPAPVPIRGIRQMPPSRVAAKLGRPFLEVTLPGRNRTETE